MTSNQSIIAHLRSGYRGKLHDDGGFVREAPTTSAISSHLRRQLVFRSSSPPEITKSTAKSLDASSGSSSSSLPVPTTTSDLASAEKAKIFPRMRTIFLSDLRKMLDDVEKSADRDIVSWGPRGLTFIVRSKPLFAATIAPKYFKILSHSNFRMVLQQTWGFVVDSDVQSGYEIYQSSLETTP
jgi:hypothetical protein